MERGKETPRSVIGHPQLRKLVALVQDDLNWADRPGRGARDRRQGGEPSEEIVGREEQEEGAATGALHPVDELAVLALREPLKGEWPPSCSLSCLRLPNKQP